MLDLGMEYTAVEIFLKSGSSAKIWKICHGVPPLGLG